MRILLRILKWLSITVMSLVLLIGATVALIWYYPQVVLTDSRVNHYFQKYAGDYVGARSEAGSFVAKNGAMPHLSLKLLPNGKRGKKIWLELEPFCTKQIVEACFKTFHFEVAFQILALDNIQLETIGPINIQNEFLKYEDKPTAEKKPEEPESDSPSFLSRFTLSPNLRLDSILILSPDLKYLAGKTKAGGNFNFVSTSNQGLVFVADATEGSDLKGHAEINTTIANREETPFHLAINLQPDAKANPKAVVTAGLDGKITWHSMQFNLAGDVKAVNMIPWVKSIELSKLVVERKKDLNVSSDILLLLEPKLNFASPDSVMPKANFEAKIAGKFKVEQRKESYVYQIELGPTADNGLHLLAKLQGLYPFPKKQEYRFGLEKIFLALDVPKFQVLVNDLKRTSSAIPAPFASLTGPLNFKLGDENKLIEQDRFAVRFTTDLRSSEQDIVTASEGEVQFLENAKKIKLKGGTTLKQITLTLPDIDPLVPEPTLVHDSRIHFAKRGWKPKKVPNTPKPRPAQKKEDASNFSMDWKITTTSPGINIYYPMLKPNAPLVVTWNIQDSGTNGEVRALPFEIEYLKRTAKLDRFRYYLAPGTKEFHYEGRLIIPKTDYTIYIDVFDELGKPKVTFKSEPPLEQSDIISVLLFNQTSAELSPDQSDSVGQTQSAVTNRALGLFSLWALSSTPIEAVSYNAASHVYSARVKLANGLTATVGTNWDNTQQVALRKRLGKNFVLSTIIENQNDPNGNNSAGDSKKTLIEWFRRF